MSYRQKSLTAKAIETILFRALVNPRSDSPIDPTIIKVSGKDAIDPPPEARLAVKVIAQAIADASRTIDYGFWCGLIGLDPDYVREVAKSYWKKKTCLRRAK